MKNLNTNADKILLAAVELAKIDDYKTVSKYSVGLKAQVSPAMIPYYFGSVEGLWAAVMDYAVKNEIMSIVIRGCLNNIISAQELSPEIREKLNTYFTM
jgi:AcrR family transcriptional regulator